MLERDFVGRSIRAQEPVGLRGRRSGRAIAGRIGGAQTPGDPRMRFRKQKHSSFQAGANHPRHPERTCGPVVGLPLGRSMRNFFSFSFFFFLCFLFDG